MNNSDWIALAACIASFIALIPALAPMLKGRKKVARQTKAALPTSNASDLTPNGPAPSATSSTATPEVSMHSTSDGAPISDSKGVSYSDMNLFGKSLVLAACGLAIGVIEVVLFSAMATLFGVAVDPGTMSLPWRIVFYSLFVMPGFFMFWALVHLFNLFEDPKR